MIQHSKALAIGGVAIVFMAIGAGVMLFFINPSKPSIATNDPQPPAQDQARVPELDQVGTDLAGRPIYSTALHALAFNPDGTLFAVGAGDGGLLRVSDFRDDGYSSWKIQAHDNWAFAIAFLDDGTIVTGGGDNLIKHWDDDMNLIREFREGGHRNDVHAIAVSPDNKTLYSAGDDRRLIAWSIEEGSILYDQELHDEQVPAMRLSPDGKQIATGSRDDRVRLVDAATGKVQHTLDAHRNDVLDLSYSPDGRVIVSASYDSTVQIHDTASGEPVQTILSHKDRVFAVAFSPDGQLLATGGEDHDLVIHRTSDWSIDQRIDTEADISRIAFSPDGEMIAITSSNGIVSLYRVGSIGPHLNIQYRAESPQGVESQPEPAIPAQEVIRP